MFPHSHRRAFTLVELFVIIFVIAMLLVLLIPWVHDSGCRPAARRAACINNLKQIGLALHNYYDARKCFPPSSTQPLLTPNAPPPGSDGTDGKGAGFSWTTLILPYIEQRLLYEKVNIETGCPFDGSADHVMVGAVSAWPFRCASFPGPDYSQAADYPKDSQALTNYVAIGATHLASLYGKEKRAVGGRNHPNGVIYPGSTTGFSDIVDGNSNTLVVCETKELRYAAWFDGTTAAVVGLAEETSPSFKLESKKERRWYEPVDGVKTAINYGDEEARPPKCYLSAGDHSGMEDWVHGPSSNHPGVVNHLLGDGSVRSVSEGIDPRLYARLITREGGEPVEEFHNQ